jgi:hypothetical protein
LTAVKRTERPARVSGVTARILEFLSIKFEVATLTERQDILKKDLMSEVAKNGEPDEKGNLFLELPTPVTVHGQTFGTLKRERRVSIVFDAEVAEQILVSHGLLEAATTIPEPVPFLDQDKIYVLHQEGKLTEEEIDSMFNEHESFAFKPLAS